MSDGNEGLALPCLSHARSPCLRTRMIQRFALEGADESFFDAMNNPVKRQKVLKFVKDNLTAQRYTLKTQASWCG